jgi:hypothetical protein
MTLLMTFLLSLGFLSQSAAGVSSFRRLVRAGCRHLIVFIVQLPKELNNVQGRFDLFADVLNQAEAGAFDDLFFGSDTFWGRPAEQKGSSRVILVASH